MVDNLKSALYEKAREGGRKASIIHETRIWNKSHMINKNLILTLPKYPFPKSGKSHHGPIDYYLFPRWVCLPVLLLPEKL
jgi:hypothetical protein